MTIKVTHIPKTEHKHGIPFVVMQTPIIIIPPIIKEIPPSRWHFFLLAISFLLSPQIRIINILPDFRIPYDFFLCVIILIAHAEYNPLVING